MTTRAIIPAIMLGLALAPSGRSQDAEKLPPPGFHHLHLNSTNPSAAIDFYVKNFQSTSRSTWGGMPALKTGKVYVLFTKVNAPPALLPQTAVWHFGWHVTDERASLKRYQEIGTKLLPLYTGEGDNFVYVNSDTWPGGGGPGGALGRTQSQIAEAKAQGIKPAGGAGFGYIGGPDGAMIEFQGDMPAERFNHVHMYQEDPFCAQLWYEKHLNAPASNRGPQPTEADCKVARGTEPSWPALEKPGMYRIPAQVGVNFDDVTATWYMNPGNAPLAPTRGHLVDHFGISVANLDAWVAKLQKENVKFLRKTYKLGDTRAVMIEGPSREAIELVEVK
jgi:catechol 2,3-dioxygenase-like lactoylglutathione lyase family enzyme